MRNLVQEVKGNFEQHTDDVNARFERISAGKVKTCHFGKFGKD